jgi:diaminopimelate decarboxylase
MSDNLRPMLYGARYEAHLADRIGAPGEPARVVGRHCESGDVLVEHATLAEPRAGDVLVVPATGAYGHALANQYNGQLRPPVVFVSGGDARVVVRRDTEADLLARDV